MAVIGCLPMPQQVSITDLEMAGCGRLRGSMVVHPGQYRKLEPGRVMTSPRNSGEARIAVLDIQEAPPCQATAMNTELFGQRGRRLALTQTIDDASFEGRTERAAGARWMIWIHLTPQGLGVQLLGVSSPLGGVLFWPRHDRGDRKRQIYQ